MDNEDYESDIHLCLRCNTHIDGLENYIQHRKSACKQQMISQSVVPVIATTVSETTSPALLESTVLHATLLDSTTLQLTSQPALPDNATTSEMTSPASLESTVLQATLLGTTSLQLGSLESTSLEVVSLQSSTHLVSVQPQTGLHNSETIDVTNYIENCVDSRELVCEQLLHDIQENVETKKDIREDVINKEHNIKEFVEEGNDDTEKSVEKSSGRDGSMDVHLQNVSLDAKEDYSYSRYLEAKLLGNISADYKRPRGKARASTNLPKAKGKNHSELNCDTTDDTLCKDEESDVDYCETRRRKYRRKKPENKSLNQTSEEKKNESSDSRNGVSDNIEEYYADKKTVESAKVESNTSDVNSDVNLEKSQSKSTPKTWTCPVCNKVLRARAEHVHMRVHSGDKPFKCHLCTYASKTHSDMRMHMKRHLGIKEFKCTECDYASTKKSMLKKHIHRHQRKKGLEDFQYQCDECGKRYASIDGLKIHIRTVHENIKPFTCSFDNCKYAAVSNSELEIHIRTHTKEKPFLCTQCGYKAGNKNRLRRHMITHTDETPFKCDYPGCAFAGKTAFRVRRHKKQHDPVNRLCCPYCSYTTFYLGNLRKHIKNTTKHKDTKVYLCDICKTFNTDVYKDLIDHYDEVHKGDVDVTVHSGGINLGQFNHLRQQELIPEENIIIIPEEAIVIADTVEFIL